MQLAFDLPVRAAQGRADFLVAPSNAVAVAALDAAFPVAGRMALAGPEGAGKTHLAAIWAAETGARLAFGPNLAGTEPRALIAPALVLDGADAIAGEPEAETRAFHLLNLMADAGGRLLLVAREPPARWPVRLPDLASRLAATPVATLGAPDERLLAGLLVKLFADRQLAVTPALVSWLAARIDRSCAAAFEAVAVLDAAALAHARPVTRALAAEVLDFPALPRR